MQKKITYVLHVKPKFLVVASILGTILTPWLESTEVRKLVIGVTRA